MRLVLLNLNKLWCNRRLLRPYLLFNKLGFSLPLVISLVYKVKFSQSRCSQTDNYSNRWCSSLLHSLCRCSSLLHSLCRCSSPLHSLCRCSNQINSSQLRCSKLIKVSIWWYNSQPIKWCSRKNSMLWCSHNLSTINHRCKWCKLKDILLLWCSHNK